MAAVTDTTTTPLVRLDRVRKEFGAVVALEEVSLDVAARASRRSSS
jgi:ABC-type sugar transport system ATPase subunit